MQATTLPASIPTHSGACDRYEWASHRSEVRMLHPDFDFFMVLKGAMQIQWPDGSQVSLRPGGFVLIPPLTLITVRESTPKLVYWFCHFNFRLLPSTLHTRLQTDFTGPGQPITVPLVFRAREAPAVARAYRSLAGLRFGPGAVPWRFESALLRLVGELKHFGWRRGLKPQDGAQERIAQDARLTKVLAGINAEPQRRWTVPELAASVGISADRLNTISQRLTRRTLKQHILQARFRLAFQLLRDNQPERASIKEVSARCGFASQHFFCKQFKRWFNLTPTEFRDSTLCT